MQIIVIGVNHKTAPVEVREKLALGTEQGRQALDFLGTYAQAGVIVSTCNRTEVYTTCDKAEEGFNSLGSFLGNYHSLAQEEVEPYLYRYSAGEAVRHLFRVASGIDSMILGEYEILGQVREALSSSVEAGTMNHPLSKLFHHGLRVGRRARRETLISRQAVSVSFTAVQLAKRVFGEIGDCKVLVISAGQAGKLAGKALRDWGAKEIAVTNRTPERAMELARELEGRALPFARLEQELLNFDIIISATSSPHFVLTRDAVAEALPAREGRPLCLIDIAVPRDVDPAVTQLPGVFLYDIDDLQELSEAHLREREREVAAVEALVEGEVVRFMRWWNTLDVVPVIASLREKVEAVRCRELAKTLKRLPHLTPAEQMRLERLTRAIVNRILHDPIVTLKEQGRERGYMQAVEALFHLGPEEESSSDD